MERFHYVLLVRSVPVVGQGYRKANDQQWKSIGVQRVGDESNAIDFEDVFERDEQFECVDEYPREGRQQEVIEQNRRDSTGELQIDVQIFEPDVNGAESYLILGLIDAEEK